MQRRQSICTIGPEGNWGGIIKSWILPTFVPVGYKFLRKIKLLTLCTNTLVAHEI